MDGQTYGHTLPFHNTSRFFKRAYKNVNLRHRESRLAEINCDKINLS